MSAQSETFEFQAEARQLLQLVVHSIYSNKDIFLRELISNASDALDKLRLESLLDKDLQVDTSDLHIDVDIDAAARTLTVRDNGVGMSREEVMRLIGTIARSGTAEFLAAHKGSDASADALIGQFGVGFYAAFMVADRVGLTTRRAGEQTGTRWESEGDGTYTIAELPEAPQGTAVTLHLKPADTEDQLHDYTSPWRVREIIKQHSDFIAHPIRMAKPDTGTAGKAAADGTTDGTTGDTADGTSDGSTGTEPEAAPEVETVNSMKALWARPKSEVTEAEYHEFYRHVSHDWTDPLEIIQLRAEGNFEYQALLFIPSRAPFDLYMQEQRIGVQLYVKRVFIMDDCEALVPSYLRFVKGVVDAADLSLNVSREILQQDRQIQLMRRRLVRKVLSTITEMKAQRPESYATFWTAFGRTVKEGLINDADNRAAILDFSSFASSRDPEALTTLAEYKARMVDGQTEIYYLTGDNRGVLEQSPHMEAFRARNIEVLLLTDPVDEVWVDAVREFDGTPLRSIAKGQVDLDGADKTDDEADSATEGEFADLLTWLGTTLTEKVKQVRLSSRLTTSAVCLVGDAHDLTPSLERMYRAMGQDVPEVKRILELNPTHPLVTGLRDAHRSNADDPSLGETAELLYGMALLAEGGELTDPAGFVRLLAGRLTR